MKEAAKYTMVGQRLYRRGFAFPLLKCLDQEEAEYTMKEVHEGICGTHIGGRALASKIARADTTDARGSLKDTEHPPKGCTQVGGGHLRVVPLSTRTNQVSNCGSGLLHQMDRSRAGRHYLCGES
ncbi:hypothetical protein CR513_25161, partial [Mucuna pruriens]